MEKFLLKIIGNFLENLLFNSFVFIRGEKLRGFFFNEKILSFLNLFFYKIYVYILKDFLDDEKNERFCLKIFFLRIFIFF